METGAGVASFSFIQVQTIIEAAPTRAQAMVVASLLRRHFFDADFLFAMAEGALSTRWLFAVGGVVSLISILPTTLTRICQQNSLGLPELCVFFMKALQCQMRLPFWRPVAPQGGMPGRVLRQNPNTEVPPLAPLPVVVLSLRWDNLPCFFLYCFLNDNVVVEHPCGPEATPDPQAERLTLTGVLRWRFWFRFHEAFPTTIPRFFLVVATMTLRLVRRSRRRVLRDGSIRRGCACTSCRLRSIACRRCASSMAARLEC
jgi:hypothetical protein